MPSCIGSQKRIAGADCWEPVNLNPSQGIALDGSGSIYVTDASGPGYEGYVTVCASGKKEPEAHQYHNCTKYRPEWTRGHCHSLEPTAVGFSKMGAARPVVAEAAIPGFPCLVRVRNAIVRRRMTLTRVAAASTIGVGRRPADGGVRPTSL